MRFLARSAVLALVVAGAVAGCSSLPAMPTPAPPVGVRVATPPERMWLHVSNGTTIPVLLTVNGGAGRPIAAGQGTDLGLTDLGPLPWAAQVRTGTGRVLVELTVHAGDAWTQDNGDGSGSSSGAAARVDLSCGRIDISSGIYLHGPAPGPGTPGDCDP
ncbi:MAG TPA: hypothetical protein VES19_12675 [Candidatus Limnocylindrales bacterium]|nr:hypothetical protein [Candidatus Limnocylindrales bacterium]